jgi:hypothetical protein
MSGRAERRRAARQRRPICTCCSRRIESDDDARTFYGVEGLAPVEDVMHGDCWWNVMVGLATDSGKVMVERRTGAAVGPMVTADDWI